jgi:hypothetical protein
VGRRPRSSNADSARDTLSGSGAGVFVMCEALGLPLGYLEGESIVLAGATLVRHFLSTSGVGTISIAQQLLMNMNTL